MRQPRAINKLLNRDKVSTEIYLTAVVRVAIILSDLHRAHSEVEVIVHLSMGKTQILRPISDHEIWCGD